MRVLAIRDDGARLAADPDMVYGVLITADGVGVLPVASALARGDWHDGTGVADVPQYLADQAILASDERDELDRKFLITKTVIPQLAKVGPEGYIHGYICVRPPCGKEPGNISPGDLWLKKDGTVIHKPSGYRIGHVDRDSSSHTWTVFTAQHHDGSQVYQGTRKREALASLAAHHNALSGTAPKPELSDYSFAHRFLGESSTGKGRVHEFKVTAPDGKIAASALAYDRGNHVWLDQLITSSHDRGKGLASRLLKHVLDEFSGREIRLKPEPYGDTPGEPPVMDEAGLRAFYSRHGFTGTNSEEMIRPAEKPAGGKLPEPEPHRDPGSAQPAGMPEPLKPPEPVKEPAELKPLGDPAEAAATLMGFANRLKAEADQAPYSASSRLGLYHTLRIEAEKILDGDNSSLTPGRDQFGAHVPAKVLDVLDDLSRRIQDALDSARETDPFDRKKLTAASKGRLAQLRQEAKTYRDELARNDPDSFTPGDFIATPRQPSGSFRDLLSSEDLASLTGLIKTNRLSFPENSGDDDRLDDLKAKSVQSALEKAGLPPSAAYFISGGQTGDGQPDRDWYSFAGLKSFVRQWSVSGREAEDISQMFRDSMSTPEPPPLRSTDFDGAYTTQTRGYGSAFNFADMSPEAGARRQKALDYWMPRAQAHYTQNVMETAGRAGKPIPVSRIVGGEYAARIMDAEVARVADGSSWRADSRDLSSWAEPGRIASAKKYVQSWSKPPYIKLTQNADPSQVFMHWRGEGILRNGVKILGEIVVSNADLNSRTTQVESL